jgi:hypothetical protein
MTDNDIIKALECCRDFGDCSLCPYEKATLENEADCAERMHTDALGLINRQKAEIERLEEHNNILIDRVDNLVYECDCAKQEAIKEFAERLKNRFTEKLGDKKESFFSYSVQREIDNLLE